MWTLPTILIPSPPPTFFNLLGTDHCHKPRSEGSVSFCFRKLRNLRRFHVENKPPSLFPSWRSLILSRGHLIMPKRPQNIVRTRFFHIPLEHCFTASDIIKMSLIRFDRPTLKPPKNQGSKANPLDMNEHNICSNNGIQRKCSRLTSMLRDGETPNE